MIENASWDEPNLTPKHFVELKACGISDAIALLNFQSLEGDAAVEAVAGFKLEKAGGHGHQYATKSVESTLRQYDHCRHGGWWCNGLDPLNNWELMAWGCFKLDTPRTDSEGKVIKYEHPPTESTRVFFLRTEDPDYWRNVESDRSIPLILTEGAKKAACGLSHGFATVAVPGIWQVTKKNSDELREELKGIVQRRLVYIAFDEDSKPKTRKAVKAATRRAAIAVKEAGAKEVRIVRWNHKQGKGMDDLIVNEGKEAFEKAIDDAEPLTKQKKPSCATALLEIASALELFNDDEGKAYADVMVNGIRQTYPLESKAFRDWLGYEYYKDTGRAPNSEGIKTAIATLSGKAKFEGGTREVSLRVAKNEGKHYIDLGDESWQAVEIDSEGWRIVSDPPVRFRRPPTLGALPVPTRDGKLDDLKDLLNVNEDEWTLITTFLLYSMTLQPTYPVLLLSASRGSGKSTIMEFLKSLIDPGKAGLIGLSGDEHRMSVAAQRRWMLAYDNVSYINPLTSDILCKIATKMGFSTRTLHTTDEETVFEIARPQMITAIDHIVTRDDLADRVLMVQLPEIPPEKRLKKSDLDAKLDALRPGIFGALLNALSQTLNDLPRVEPERLPRMADYGHFAIASEPALKLGDGTFWNAFNSSRETAREIVLEASPLAEAVRALVDKQIRWSGKASDLLKALKEYTSDEVLRSSSWPKAPNSLSRRLNRLQQDLRFIGVDLQIQRKNRTRIISLQRRVENDEKIPSLSSPSSQPKSRKDFSGDDMVTVLEEGDDTVTDGDDSDDIGDDTFSIPSPIEPFATKKCVDSDDSDDIFTLNKEELLPGDDGSDDWEDIQS